MPCAQQQHLAQTPPVCSLMSEFGPGSLPCDVGAFGSLSGLDQVQNVDFTGVGLTGSLPDSWSSGFGSLQKLVSALPCQVYRGYNSQDVRKAASQCW